jgi:RNA polymerase sigma-70 factor, ECF subfamily
MATQSGDQTLLSKAISAAQRGDPSALHLLYVRYAEEVRVYVETIVHEPHDAEDITHDVFAKLMSAISSYEVRSVPFSAWILRVARNAALDHLRRRRSVPCGEVLMETASGAETHRERTRSLRAAFERLPADQRQVVLLRHVAGLSPREIAERLEKSEGSVHCLHHRGRGRLKSSLRELGAAPVTLAA